MKPNLLKIHTILLITLVALFTGCSGEAPTVNPSDLTQTYASSEDGTSGMTAKLIYPTDGSSGIPIDANIVIRFSKDVDVDFPNVTTVITIDDGAAVGYANPAFDANVLSLVPSADLSYGLLHTITVNTGLTSVDPDGLGPLLGSNLDQTYTWTFTTGTDTSALLNPRVLAGSQSPTGGAVSINTSYIEVTFSKDVSPLVTTGTFTISPGVGTSPVSQVGLTNTYRIDLDSPLTYNTVYTVDLTNGITDLDEDGEDTWTFTTETAPAGLPALTISSVYVDSITDTTATVHWTTNRPILDTSSNVDFGLNTGYGTVTNEGATGTTSYDVHSVNLTGLTEGTKYYFIASSTDTSPTTVTDTGTFYTKYSNPVTENPGSAVKDDSGDNSELSVLQNTDISGAYDGSSYLVFKNGTDIYAYYFDTGNPPSEPWGIDGDVIDSGHNGSNIKIFSDEHGSAVITYETGGNIYAKKISNGGAAPAFAGEDWGSVSGDTGVSVGTGSNPSAALVWGDQGTNNIYNGFITKQTSGTATHNIPANPFYDFTNTFTSVSNSDHVINNSSYSHTQLTKSTNFRHVIGQGAAVIASGNSYTIGSDTNKTASENSSTHATYTTGNPATAGTNYTNTGPLTVINTEHNYAINKGAWTVGQFDILLDNSGNYRFISINPVQITLSSTINLSGNTASTNTISGLIDSTKDFSALGSGFQVDNTTAVTSALESGSSATDKSIGLLKLDTSIFYGYPQNYAIDPGGVNITGTTSPCIVDASSPFTTGIIGNIVLNTTTSKYGRIEQYYATNVVSLDSNLFPTPPDTYNTYTGTYCSTHLLDDAFSPFYQITVDSSIATDVTSFTIYEGILQGTAATPPTNPLYDDANDFSGTTVNVNDYVVNTTDFDNINTPNVEQVGDDSSFGTRALNITKTLTDDIMTDNDTYEIIRYTATSTIRETGNISSVSGNQLTDSTDYAATFITNSVNKGDIVYNITRDAYAVVSVNPVSETVLTLSKDITSMAPAWTAGDDYIVFQSAEPLLDTGSVTTTATGTLNDSNSDFSNVNIGDTVHNITTGSYSVITDKPAASQLTLSPSSTVMTITNNYVIFQTRVLFAFENSGDIFYTLTRLNDGSEYGTGGTISNNAAALQNPHTISDSNGGAYVIYENGTTIYGKRVNGIGTIQAGGATGAVGTTIGTGQILDIKSDSAGGFIILYENGANFIVNRYDSTINQVWAASITTAGSDAVMAIDSSGNPIVSYVDATGDLITTRLDSSSNGATLYSQTIAVSPLTSTILGLSIIADGEGGAIVTWADDRYYSIYGFTIFSQAIDNSGSFLAAWDADSDGGNTDYLGLIQGLSSTILDSEVSIKSLFYNDAGTLTAPYGGLFIWLDYRNSRADIFYNTHNR